MRTKKKLLEIEVPADGQNGVRGGLWCMFFMYTKHHGNFILKGYWREVGEYIKKQNYGPHFYCQVGFRKYEKNWVNWEFWKDGINIYEPCKLIKQPKWVVKPRKEDFNKVKTRGIMEFRFKRMPNRWIPEFDLL